jgi:hypothetical protein
VTTLLIFGGWKQVAASGSTQEGIEHVVDGSYLFVDAYFVF